MLSLCASGLLWMMVVKTDQSSERGKLEAGIPRRKRIKTKRRCESHVMDITIKNSGIVQAVSTKRGKNETGWEGG